MFYLLFQHGLERDPIGALGGMIEEVRGEMMAAGIEAPLRATLALSDGETVYALRHASDAAPPTLYHARTDQGLIVVSEPLDDQAFDWIEVPPGHVLVSEAGATPSVLPL